MALHSKWVDGNLVFYDGVTDCFKIRGSTGALVFGTTGVGCLAKEYYAETTGTAGVSYTGDGGVTGITIVKGIVTACSS